MACAAHMRLLEFVSCAPGADWAHRGPVCAVLPGKLERRARLGRTLSSPTGSDCGNASPFLRLGVA